MSAPEKPPDLGPPLPGQDTLALYRLIANLLPVAVAITDPQGRIVEANAAAAAIFDRPREQLLGHEVTAARWPMFQQDGSPLPPHASPAAEALAQGAMRGPALLGMRRTDGAMAWLRTWAAPIPLPGYGVVLVAQDETAHCATMDALHAREQRYRLALVAGGLGSWEWNMAARTLHLDVFLKQMLGFAETELPSTVDAWAARIHPDDRESVLAAARAHVEGALDVFEMEHRMLHKDGRILWFLTRGAVVRDDAGKPLLFRGTHVDVTHFRHAREAAAKGERLAQSITDNLPLGLAVIDSQRHIVLANHKLRQWYPHVDFDSLPQCRLLLPTLAQTAPCPCETTGCCRDTPRELHLDVPLPHGMRTLRFSFCPLPTAAPGGQDVVLLVEDVTEKLAVEARLHRAQKLEAMGTLAAGIAHEINQPLNALQLYGSGLEMLLESNPSLPVATIRERIGLMLQEANKVRDIINHMRALSRLDTPAAIQPVDMAASVRSALQLVRAQLAAHGIELALHLPAALPHVLASPVQLEQVVINLVVNAMQALDTLPVDPLRPKLIRVEGCARGGQVLLIVEDNGPGLGGRQDRLFDPFFTTKDASLCMGLGLSIVHSLARSWGADVLAEAAAGQGARFSLVLRAADPS
ncbi:PAS domain-containing protein [Megalodesulfovibrio gigas]|uniref:histidine kinase n=1 Tax=Megalodesulfovibrio gigas (strain ATCC 19364 / DSM 1382 / NCIMB 9332 / VKM B-1759) TaxID=1121448 RepID=T2GAJ6_MEGG1|nr:PAS domain-containing protein [Megalodesulfovibrio gigas]AGW12942.1 putative sensory box protein [Megalodesulfovibrio gigas DSM 1382 = ATCC 19364]